MVLRKSKQGNEDQEGLQKPQDVGLAAQFTQEGAEHPAEQPDQAQSGPPTGPVKPSTLMASLEQEALSQPVGIVSPSTAKTAVTDDELSETMKILSNTFQVPKSSALVATALLFLKGAASQGTPASLSVEVVGKEISKRDLANAYGLAAKNQFLRRLAEKLAEFIGRYAEKNGLKGELADRLNRSSLAETGEALTAKEQAWCSSFSQSLTNLKDLASERVVKLLAQDYQTRFVSKNEAKGKKNKKQGEQADSKVQKGSKGVNQTGKRSDK